MTPGISRRGNTVLRPTGPWPGAVHEYLRHLEAAGFGGAPRFLGREEHREILTFLDGDVPIDPEWQPGRVQRLPDYARSETVPTGVPEPDSRTMMLGQTLVEFVPDTQVRGPAEEFFPGSDWSAHRHLLDDSEQLTANVGSFLVRTDTHVTLIDLGLGPGGTLLDDLARHDVAPADVDLVLFTHLHRDHVGWTGAFPRAKYLVDQREWEYWCARPGGVGPDPDRVLTPLASRIAFLDQTPPGLRPIATPGHTPGHTSVLITDPHTADRILVLGDLLHTPAQFAEPNWRFRSDADPDQARRQRIDVLDRYRDGSTILAGGHFTGDVFAPQGLRPTAQYTSRASAVGADRHRDVDTTPGSSSSRPSK